ncbi:type II secretion system protein GspF [Wenzhouxiangella sp. XN79A]|uniref:type II secretion system F family protein n=1 Tax=Wenzhouxiangella sp. XN79A TaxID=2724193 RepID=UPI00144A60CE|nr:type II secretion system F family protein [Wenzhouxiangella sp. XN79A]NKI34452.1 type II secretion system protein GspF [Wenzhouxiangella sp. XN79A]
MAAFEYEALDEQKSVRGVVQADSARQARSQLRERGLVPLEVRPVQAAGRRGGAARLVRERALLLRQMAGLLRAGLPLEDVLALLAEQTDRPAVHRPLAAMRSRVREGAALSEAMAEQPALFPPLVWRSVAAGEQAGRLETVIARLADHAERRAALSRGIVMALVYPLLLGVLSLAVVWGLLGFVVPRVVEVFSQSNQALPALTRSLIWISDALAGWGGLLLLVLLGLAAGGALLLRRPGPRRAFDGALLGLPLIGRVVRAHASALFARTLAILMASGVPAVDALGTAASVMSNRRVRDDLEQAGQRVREGSSITASVAEIGWMPPLTRRLIAGGEQAGDLAGMLDHAAELQEADLEQTGAVLLAVLQPALILLVGLVVLYIVLAILLPVMNLSQMLG